MATFLKRFSAYIVDYFIITIVIYAIMLLPFVNPHNEEYQTKYNELINVNEQFMNEEINKEEYDAAFVPIAYDLYRLNGSYVIVSTICFLAYFGVFQYFFKGQTLGKKLFRFKVVSSNDKELTLVNYILRAVVLYNILIPILELFVVSFWNVDTYLPIYQNVNMVGYVIMYITIFMILVRKDGRGLHDFVANTKVLYDENQPSWRPWQKVIDLKSFEENEEEPKEEKKKSNKKKESKKAKPNKK